MAPSTEPTFTDWLAVHTLLRPMPSVRQWPVTGAAAMFEHATYREARGGRRLEFETYQGTEQVHEYMCRTRATTTAPRTKHVNTNVIIELDGDTATSRCYLTVLQQTPTLPLQPVAAGRYVDRFERVDGEWRFADRLITGFLVGDVSQHKDRPSP
jgi:hypothetical protein